jgi:hypothetical protein
VELEPAMRLLLYGCAAALGIAAFILCWIDIPGIYELFGMYGAPAKIFYAVCGGGMLFLAIEELRKGRQ